MPDREKLLADLRAAVAIEHPNSNWTQADKAREARAFIRNHGPALIEMVEREGEVSNALSCVIVERKLQDAKWGEQNHEPADWMLILGEEFGEVCKAALEAKFNGDKLPDACLSEYRMELVQTAAVAVAAIEALDRARKEAT